MIQSREEPANFDTSFFSDGRMPALDDDLDRFFGLGETVLFCNVPSSERH